MLQPEGHLCSAGCILLSIQSCMQRKFLSTYKITSAHETNNSNPINLNVLSSDGEIIILSSASLCLIQLTKV
jgi:hypothetical protein